MKLFCIICFDARTFNLLKLLFMKKTILAASVLLSSSLVKAQDINQILSSSKQDINRFTNEYFRPFGEGQIYNLSRGWFNTAKAHKKLGFDISVRVQTASIPSGKENFTFRNADYQTLRLSGTTATSASLPTFFGGNTTQNLQVGVNTNGIPPTASFKAPDGVGGDFKKLTGSALLVPLPIVQVGLGLIKSTDVKLRYLPKTNIGDRSDIGIMGVAVQHEFSNYLPFIKKVPFLHFAALAGYSKIDVNYRPEVKGSTVTSNNALTKYSISAFTVQAIASAKLAIFEVYTSVGYSSGKSNLDILGTYRVQDVLGGSRTITDPATLSFSGSGVNNTTGVRLNLAFFKIYGDYTFGNYKGASAGVAFSFR